MRRLLRVLAVAKLPPNSTIGVDQLRDAFAACPAKGYVGTHRLFRRYLRERGRLGAPALPALSPQDEHLQRLIELRGIAPATVTTDNWALTDFP